MRMKIEIKATAETPFEQKFVKLELLADAANDGTISGKAMVFGSEHPTSSWALGPEWKDRVEPGAFTETLAAHEAAGTRPLMQFMHERGNVPGVWTSVKETKSALTVEGKVSPNAITPSGVPLLELLRMGAISGLSIGFRPSKVTLDEETKVRSIEKVDLAEISVVDIAGAGPSARVTDVKTKRGLQEALRAALDLSQTEAKALIAEGYRGLEEVRARAKLSAPAGDEAKGLTNLARQSIADSDSANEMTADAQDGHGSAMALHARAMAGHTVAAGSRAAAARQAQAKGDAASSAEHKAAADQHGKQATAHRDAHAALTAMNAAYAAVAPAEIATPAPVQIPDSSGKTPTDVKQVPGSHPDGDEPRPDGGGSDAKSILGLANEIIDRLKG